MLISDHFNIALQEREKVGYELVYSSRLAM